MAFREVAATEIREVLRVRPGGHGQAWEQLEACGEQTAQQVKAEPAVVKIGVLLQRLSTPMRRPARMTTAVISAAVSPEGSR
jgi:hypothetical protein